MAYRPVRAMSALCLLAAMHAIATSACSAPPAAIPPSNASPFPSATDPRAAHERAQVVLAAWAHAVAAAGNRPPVTPIGELTGQIGDWEPSVGDNNKRSLMAGNVVSATELSEDAPPDGEVTWPDGTSTKVSLMPAQQAVVAIGSTTAPDCSDCKELVLSNARLTTGPIQTTRGPATAPIWTVAVQGSAVMVTRVAVATARVVASPGEADPALSPPMESASGTVAGKELTVSFVGAPDPGDQPCGEDYTAEAVESDLAVVVIVTRHPHFAPAQACSPVGAMRTATASLRAPIGDRVVLDLREGTPLPLVLAT